MGVYSAESAGWGIRIFSRNSRKKRNFGGKLPFFGDILRILGLGGKMGGGLSVVK